MECYDASCLDVLRFNGNNFLAKALMSHLSVAVARHMHTHRFRPAATTSRSLDYPAWDL